MDRSDCRWHHLLAGTCLAALLAWAPPLTAQEEDAPAVAGAATEPEAAADADLLEPNEIDALVAPVVLYPDPLLALVLQASITPLDLVEADRFLLRREKDPSLVPDADWDPSVLGLLNYPELVTAMSEYLDWTQLLGAAVVDQLDAVQASIQILREAAVEQGILVSNEVQKVVVVDELIVVAPVDKGTLSVPQYDPVQLLAALTPAESAPEGPPAETEAVVEPPPAKPEPPPEATEELAMAETPAPPVETAPAPVESAPEVQASSVPAPAPAYYAEPAPTYMAPPPPVSYAAPQSSFWSTAATFTGGAVVGGLLGYAWGDDDNDNNDDGWDDVEDAIRDLDDDDWNDFVDNIDDDDLDDFVDRIEDRDWDEIRRGDREVNISDSTIVVGNQVKRDQLNAKLKNKRDQKQVVARGDRARLDLQNGALKREPRPAATSGDRLARDRPPRAQGLAPVASRGDASRNRQAAQRSNGEQARPRDVRLPNAGGASRQGQSRQVAQAAGQPQRRQAQAAQRPGGKAQADRAVAAGIDQPREVRRDSQRGAKSKAKAGVQRTKPKAVAQRTGGGQHAAQPQRQQAAANRGGSRPMGGVKSGSGAKRDAQRGKKSLAKGGGGRKGGGRRG